MVLTFRLTAGVPAMFDGVLDIWTSAPQVRELREPAAAKVPLASVSEGERVRIVAIIGGRGVTRKLTDMGLPIGSELTVLHRQIGGPLVVASRDVRMALGAGMARKVLVRRLDDA